MNIWGETVQSSDVAAKIAIDELDELTKWFRDDIMETGKLPPDTIQRVRTSLSVLRQAFAQMTASITRVADAQRFAVLGFLGGMPLDREQFYILLMSGFVEWSNKNLGLSDFEDFELFEMLRIERNGRQTYIYLHDDINDPPDEDPDDTFYEIMASAYRSAIIAPEDIRWGELSQEQQEFFVKYLPETVQRFKRDS